MSLKSKEYHRKARERLEKIRLRYRPEYVPPKTFDRDFVVEVCALKETMKAKEAADKVGLTRHQIAGIWLRHAGKVSP